MSTLPVPDKGALLRAAATLMHSRRPAPQAFLAFEGVKYMVRFDWPGVVSVLDVKTGETLVESSPGQPTHVALRFQGGVS